MSYKLYYIHKGSNPNLNSYRNFIVDTLFGYNILTEQNRYFLYRLINAEQNISWHVSNNNLFYSLKVSCSKLIYKNQDVPLKWDYMYLNIIMFLRYGAFWAQIQTSKVQIGENGNSVGNGFPFCVYHF